MKIMKMKKFITDIKFTRQLSFILLVLSAVIVALGILVAVLLLSQENFSDNKLPGSSQSNLSCVSSVEERIVRGTSLSGLIEPGETVKIFRGYYDCNEVKIEDIITYFYAGNSEPLIKIIKGTPGDKFYLQKSDGGWHILINDKELANSEGEFYQISDSAYNLLSLYVNDYKGVIPENTYLLLGNIPSGSVDSTQFGLVDKSDILGKVEH